MSRLNSRAHRYLAAFALTVSAGGGGALALPPAPINDDPAAPTVIGPDVPIIVHGTTVLAADDIASTTLPAPADDVDGPDVFYSFTPAASATYRVQLLPWQRAPLRSSDRRFILYIQDDLGTFIAGDEAPGSARPVHVDAALDGGTTYRIGVDYDAATHDNFPFTLVVDAVAAAGPDDCAAAADLAPTVPTAVLQDIDGASPDFAFSQGTAQCAVSGGTPTTAPGIDHVYRFTPASSGKYAFELAASGFDAVLYVNTACPPTFPGGCLGASNHSTSGSSGGKHELVVADLAAGTDYYVFVDNGSTSNNSGAYALIVDTAFDYEINEDEPNDDAGAATPVATPLNGGSLAGPTDEDWWAVSGMTGARVYAWANNGGASNSTLDTDLAFFAADGGTLIEFDDEDADGADAPIEDLRFIYSTSAPVLAGAAFTSDGTHYLRVTDQSATGTVHRYRLHVGVQPAGREPLVECEPNDTQSAADRNGVLYYRGVIDTAADADFYAFDATLGDRVFIALDGDPERDGTGTDSPGDDPRMFQGKLVIYDPDGDVLISDASDSNSIQSAPDYPAQGAFFVARSSGTHFVEVAAQSALSQVGPEETYALAVFLDDAAPGLGTEDQAPAIALTPDFDTNTVGVAATDDEINDTGICGVEFFDDTNLSATIAFDDQDPLVDFEVGLVNGAVNGRGKLVVTDCAGNSACAIVKIDVSAPVCDGFNFSNRLLTSLHEPLFVPDNQPATGVDSVLTVTEPGSVTDVDVTLTIETLSSQDMDVFLISPMGTVVELITDRGSSLAFDITQATFDDDADEIMPILSSFAPFTGTWLPEDPGGLSQLSGEAAMGDWTLNVRDDSGSPSGGARLISWTLDLDATFAGPQTFAGTVNDTVGFDCGVASLDLSAADNVVLSLPPEFSPGDLAVAYTVSLINPSIDGSGTITVTDLAENACQSLISLDGFADGAGPQSAGSVTTDRTYQTEVQADVPPSNAKGVVSSINVSDTFLVGEVEVELTVDTKDLGRLASTLTHSGDFASLINRVGMDDRGSVGLTKDNVWVTLDDDAPEADDAHLEPALGSVPFFGLHQPDGRGEFIGDGITIDRRENMLLELAGADAAGEWQLLVGDFRIQGSTDSRFRRWSMTLKSPCGAQRYVGRALEPPPQSGICMLGLAGASNLQVDATFTPGDGVVDYAVELVDPAVPGSGTLEIEDCAGNVTIVAIDLEGETGDGSPPVVGGSVDLDTFTFAGQAGDDLPGDSGIASVALVPYSTNLELLSVTPDPPAGAARVDFVVGLVDPGSNGRGYVRVTDGCGLRGHAFVEIDAAAPVCSSQIGLWRRYFSEDGPLDIPDDNLSGVTSNIAVTDPGLVEDVDVTLNITHPFDEDIVTTLISGIAVPLFSNVGFLGNDFIDTTLDDEAPLPIPQDDDDAPFTGSFQPEGGPALFALDGSSVAGGYSLRIVDEDTFNVGRLQGWSLLITSGSFADAYDGRAEDSEALGTGICSVELVDGDPNLVLTVDPAFEPGERIARYMVTMADGDLGGTGTLRVTDCGGNRCEEFIAFGDPACFDVSECADTNIDGLIDDNCTWWACEDGVCLVTAVVFADIGGFNGACPPDGAADANDRFHALNCFSNTTTTGEAGYPCEFDTPMALNVDAGGPFGECCPDGVCDGNDAFHALNAFEGINPCRCDQDIDGLSFVCPCPVPTDPPGNPVLCPPGLAPDGAPLEARVLDEAAILLVPATRRMRAGGLVDVDVFLDGPLADLRGYQLHFGIDGGHGGTLELVDLAVHDRKDAAFAGLGHWQAFNLDTAQLLAGLDTSGTRTADGAYLATLTLRASRDARGRFDVALRCDEADPAQRTFLFPTTPGARIRVPGAVSAQITVR